MLLTVVECEEAVASSKQPYDFARERDRQHLLLVADQLAICHEEEAVRHPHEALALLVCNLAMRLALTSSHVVSSSTTMTDVSCEHCSDRWECPTDLALVVALRASETVKKSSLVTLSLALGQNGNEKNVSSPARLSHKHG